MAPNGTSKWWPEWARQLAVADPIYSPTQTLDWLRCPAYRRYSRRWVSRGPWEPNRLLGSAIAAGLAQALRPPNDAASLACVETLRRDYQDNDLWTLDGLIALAEKSLALAVEQVLDVLSGGMVVATEREFGPERCRPDVVHRVADGLIVTEWKVSLKLEARSLPYRLREYENSWQLLHYAWRVGQHFGEPVTRGQVLQIALTPRPFARLHPAMTFTPAMLANWHRSAKGIWATMAADEANGWAPMNLTSCWDYNRRCEYYDGCHRLYGDEAKFPTFYDAKETDGH